MVTIAGVAFPTVGVGLLRLNLLPMRFMLMHGAVLGGALSLALDCNMLIVTTIVNIVLTLLVAKTARTMRVDAGYMSMFLMVVSVALAFILLYKYNVLAKDMLTVLWGNIYTSSWLEVAVVAGFSLFVLLFQRVFYRRLQAFYFDRALAFTAGVNESFLYYATVFVTAITVAIAMKIIGAMLLDALLLLPALIASFHARSARNTLIYSALWGLLFSLTGFFTALIFDLPVSSTIAVIAALCFLCVFAFRRKRR
jgi:zinc transport system permease protein